MGFQTPLTVGGVGVSSRFQLLDLEQSWVSPKTFSSASVNTFLVSGDYLQAGLTVGGERCNWNGNRRYHNIQVHSNGVPVAAWPPGTGCPPQVAAGFHTYKWVCSVCDEETQVCTWIAYVDGVPVFEYEAFGGRNTTGASGFAEVVRKGNGAQFPDPGLGHTTPHDKNGPVEFRDPALSSKAFQGGWHDERNNLTPLVAGPCPSYRTREVVIGRWVAGSQNCVDLPHP